MSITEVWRCEDWEVYVYVDHLDKRMKNTMTIFVCAAQDWFFFVCYSFGDSILCICSYVGLGKWNLGIYCLEVKTRFLLLHAECRCCSTWLLATCPNYTHIRFQNCENRKPDDDACLGNCHLTIFLNFQPLIVDLWG